jgi:hypothetical protein
MGDETLLLHTSNDDLPTCTSDLGIPLPIFAGSENAPRN